MTMTKIWDYLIVTAANDQQAEAYEFQIRQREAARELQQVRHCLVVPDIEGRRIGSGGSTLHSILRVLQREQSGVGSGSFEDAEAILRGLRILIIHGGGDSRRLPAYSHCGKMFVPLPAQGQLSSASALFDRLVPIFLALGEPNPAQIVVASGDALILFDASTVKPGRPGITALGSFAPASEAAHHGVFSAHEEGLVRQYLQKPSRDAQIAAGAVNRAGESVLDLGVMSLSASASVQLMRAFFVQGSQEHDGHGLVWKTSARDALFSKGIDLYREICCSLGADTTFDEYFDAVRASGSILDRTLLAEWFGVLRHIPFHLDIKQRCRFLHFGTTRQLITSGIALLAEDSGKPAKNMLILNSDVHSEITGDHAWIEGCSINGTLTLEGFNTIVGVDVAEPLRLRKGACLDVSPGRNRKSEEVWFLRYYDVDDTFKHSAEQGGTFCGTPLRNWLGALGATAADIWSSEVPEHGRTLWNARVFPALDEPSRFRDWLWLLDIESATAEQKNRFLATDRYSSSEIAVRLDQTKFLARRSKIRSTVMPDINLERSQVELSLSHQHNGNPDGLNP